MLGYLAADVTSAHGVSRSKHSLLHPNDRPRGHSQVSHFHKSGRNFKLTNAIDSYLSCVYVDLWRHVGPYLMTTAGIGATVQG